MVGTKPEHWRVLTPTTVVANIVVTLIIGFLPQHMIERLEKHLDKIDDRFEQVGKKQESLDTRLALIQGQCCRKSFIQSQESLKINEYEN